MRRELRAHLAEVRARCETRIANRTFVRDPGRLDRLAMRLAEKAAGPSSAKPGGR